MTIHDNVGKMTVLVAFLPLILQYSEAYCPQPLLGKTELLSSRVSFVNGRGFSRPRGGHDVRSTRNIFSLQVAEVSEADETKDDEKKPSKTIKVEISNNPVSKFRKLKDIMWIREATEDLTAAEFACSVESEQEQEGKKKKRAVDYEKLLSQLDRRVGDMICLPFEEVDGNEPEILEGQGMGRFVYSEEQRVELLNRILDTRGKVMEVMKRLGTNEEDETAVAIQLPEIPEISIDIPKEEESSTSSGPKLYVRDDGSLDWDGALQDRAAFRKFGGAVWARINGQNAEDISEDDVGDDVAASNGGHGQEKRVTAKIEDTPQIREAREELNDLKDKLKELQIEHTALLNSGVSAGSAVANVRLASLDKDLRTRIRLSAEALTTLEQKVSFQSLVYELERIYTYLSTELGNPLAKGYVPLQDRLNVAEYGLLESQVESCRNDMNTKGALDVDILAVIAEQMTDFKRRLGIDYYVDGLSYDKEAIQTWLNDVLSQTKEGLAFYVKGCRLFWNDLVYGFSLFGRAVQGYTLQPREVRNLRRTFKDIITFIPFIIILLIPLSPIGHVFVFGAIQRFFPEFFPSCFTEQRQNLLQLYETTEFSEFTINESMKERFSRFLEAVGFVIASRSRMLYESLISQMNEGSADDESK